MSITQPTYKINFRLQCVFYIPMMIGYTFGLLIDDGWFFLALFSQLLVGFGQVFSSIYYSSKYNLVHQQKYLTIAVVYILFLFLIHIINDSIGITIFFLCVIPVMMATWYNYNLWKRSKGAAIPLPEEHNSLDDMILDDSSLL